MLLVRRGLCATVLVLRPPNVFVLCVLLKRYDFVGLAGDFDRIFLGTNGPVREPLSRGETVFFSTDESNNL